MGVWGKRGQENGPKTEKDQTERATGLGTKKQRGDIQKWDQTDSPEIPGRGETSEIPRPPFGGCEEAANSPWSGTPSQRQWLTWWLSCTHCREASFPGPAETMTDTSVKGHQRWTEVANVGKLLRDGVERIRAFPSAHIPSWTELNWTELNWTANVRGLPEIRGKTNHRKKNRNVKNVLKKTFNFHSWILYICRVH